MGDRLKVLSEIGGERGCKERENEGELRGVRSRGGGEVVGLSAGAGARLGALHRPYLFQIGWRELRLTLLRGDRGGGVLRPHGG